MILRLARPEEFAEVGEVTLAAYVADGFLERDEEYAEELRAASHRAENAELVVAVDRDSHAVVGTVTFCRPGPARPSSGCAQGRRAGAVAVAARCSCAGASTGPASRAATRWHCPASTG